MYIYYQTNISDEQNLAVMIESHTPLSFAMQQPAQQPAEQP